MNEIKPRFYTDTEGRVCQDITLPWYVLKTSEESLLGYAGPLVVAENKVMRLKDRVELDAREWVYQFALAVTKYEWEKGKVTLLASFIEANVTNCIGYRPISEKSPEAAKPIPEQPVKLGLTQVQKHLLAMDLTTGTNYHIRELARHA